MPDNTLEDVLEWRSNVEYLLENPKTFRKEDRSTLSTIKIYDSSENCSEFEKIVLKFRGEHNNKLQRSILQSHGTWLLPQPIYLSISR